MSMLVQQRYENLGRRVAAGILDIAVLSPLSQLVYRTSKSFDTTHKELALLLMLVQGFVFFYYFLFISLYGQTIGMKIMGIALVRQEDESKVPGIKSTALHQMLFMIPAWIKLSNDLYLLSLRKFSFIRPPETTLYQFYIFSIVAMISAALFSYLRDPRRQLPHDTITQTVVINKNFSEASVVVR